MPAKRLQITNGDEGEEDLDDTIALLSLIAAFALEDINEIKAQQEGKGQDGALTDEELALRLFAEEAGALDTVANDMLVAQSLDRALKTDAGLLEELARTEEIARRDREYAIAISQGRRPTYQAVQPLRNGTAPRLPDTSIGVPATAIGGRKLIEPLSSQRTSSTLIPAASPSAGKESDSTSQIRVELCVICRDAITGPVIRAPCGDTYDVDCLVDLYRAATVDESLFPPACCRQPFKMDEIRVHLDSALIKLVDKKTIEFGTKNRVYCHVPTCSAFIGAATATATRLPCTTCWAYTCGHCKAVAHATAIRCTNAEDAALLALAEQTEWKRCPSCGHLIELTVGCYHMMCRCRHQFCYLCTATWKNCSCRQWDEHRLLAAAEHRVQRQGVQAPAQGGNVVEFRQRVAREAERLREDHDCVHRWRYISTAGSCEGCGHYLRIFLFQCRGCQMWVCARCRRNRWL